MMKIAALLTCFNRKNKTLACLESLFDGYELYKNKFTLSIYLTDDGCSDGTSEAIVKAFPDKDITILTGTGTLYWAGGMRNSWRYALKNNYDGYLLLNDDTLLCRKIFKELFNTHEFCLKTFACGGIYIGTTCSSNGGRNITYGGSVITNKWKIIQERLIPNGRTPQECDCGNANIMYVTSEVVSKIGILHNSFVHGFADYDYTLSANKANIPVMITPGICGVCDGHLMNFEDFAKKKISDRIKFTYSPLGFEFSKYLIYIRRNFWYRVPFVVIASLIKILLPHIYISLNKKIR